MVLTAELSKLKKPELITLIIHKRLPPNFTSETLSDFMRISGPSADEAVVLRDESVAVGDIPEVVAVSHIECANKQCLKNKWRVEAQQHEISCMKQIVKYANDRISDLEMIVGLLNKPVNDLEATKDRISRKSKNKSVTFNLPPQKNAVDASKDGQHIHRAEICADNTDEVDRSRSTDSILPSVDGPDSRDSRDESDIGEDLKKCKQTFSSVKKRSFASAVKNRQNSIVFGSGNVSEVSDIRAVPKLGYVHVYRLDPNTREETVSNYIKSIVPDSKCEILTSKFPDVYASFKVTLPLNDVDKIMNPSVWPVGTRVSRFFHRRKPMQSIK